MATGESADGNGVERSGAGGGLVASFVGLERVMSRPIDWSAPDMPDLWVYHLNYFDDLPATASGASPPWKAELVEHWIEQNPPVAGAAWDPYPTARRIANWVRWIFETDPREPTDAVVRGRLLASLAAQARHLHGNLELHLLGNHLLTNAKGLVAAGLLFGGDEGDRWLSRGLGLLEQELDYQVLSDGGHIERSPMYHAVLLGDVLDVLNLLRASGEASFIADGLLDGTAAMLGWLAAVTHPDGQPAFFNDTACRAAPTLAELAAYAGRLGVRWRPPSFDRVHMLDPSAYARLSSTDGRTVVVFDAAGPMGPDEQPGHGHCDALSFELSRDGRRLVVNSGISTYEAGDVRHAERGTAAHNTVRIDRQEQSEIWASHRVGRRARPTRSGVEGPEAYGAHDGYARLPGGPMHERRLRLEPGALVVTDRFSGKGEHELEWFLHLHPDCDAAVDGNGVVVSREDHPVARLVCPDGLPVSVERGTWHPGFHESVPNVRVEARCRAALPASYVIVLEWLD